MESTELEYGFLLHGRAYRETSVIGEFFLRGVGRVSLLYRGVKKGGKQGAKMRLLQPFIPLVVGFSGRRELKNGRQLEVKSPMMSLTGARLYSGLYINELMMRLLHKDEPHESLFDHYQQALQQLEHQPIEVVLRQFERTLLTELGFELVLNEDTCGRAIQPEKQYFYSPDSGFDCIHAIPNEKALRHYCFAGEHLIAIQQGNNHPDMAKVAKRLSRLALAPHLGDKPLVSRTLFIKR